MKSFFRKKIFVLFLSVFLMSCNGEGSTGNLIHYVGKDFSISVPTSREFIDTTDNILPVPSRGKIVVSASSKVFKKGFKNNILLLSDTLSTFSTSKDFSIREHVGSIKSYASYKELDSKSIRFTDQDTSMLYIFEAQYNGDTPTLKFLQTARVCNQNKGFLITIALGSNTKELSRYENLLSSFSCAPKK